MIKNFRHKGLKKFYTTGNQKGIAAEHVTRLRLIIARLDASQNPQDMNLPGLDLHPLKGRYQAFWSVSVSGDWRVVFRFDGNCAVDVDYVDYH
jgi:proteic killer suppression protein